MGDTGLIKLLMDYFYVLDTNSYSLLLFTVLFVIFAYFVCYF